VREHFETVGCGTIYKTAGEGRVPVYTTTQPAQEPIPYSGADESPPVFGRRWKLATDGFGLQRDDVDGNYVHIDDAISVLHQSAAQPAQEPVAWRTFDGEGGYEYRSYEDNESYLEDWNKRNPKHISWVEPLYAAPPQPAQEPEPDELAIAYMSGLHDGKKQRPWVDEAAIRADERERIKAANAPEIERINAYIKSLEDAVQDEREARAKLADAVSVYNRFYSNPSKR